MIFRQFLHTDPVVAASYLCKRQINPTERWGLFDAYVTRTGKTAASSGRPPLNRQIWEGLVLNA